MNKSILKWLYKAILDRTHPATTMPFKSDTERLEFIMFALGEICKGLGTDGTQESIDVFMKD